MPYLFISDIDMLHFQTVKRASQSSLTHDLLKYFYPSKAYIKPNFPGRIGTERVQSFSSLYPYFPLFSSNLPILRIMFHTLVSTPQNQHKRADQSDTGTATLEAPQIPEPVLLLHVLMYKSWIALVYGWLIISLNHLIHSD